MLGIVIFLIAAKGRAGNFKGPLREEKKKGKERRGHSQSSRKNRKKSKEGKPTG